MIFLSRYFDVDVVCGVSMRCCCRLLMFFVSVVFYLCSSCCCCCRYSIKNIFEDVSREFDELDIGMLVASVVGVGLVDVFVGVAYRCIS